MSICFVWSMNCWGFFFKGVIRIYDIPNTTFESDDDEEDDDDDEEEADDEDDDAEEQNQGKWSYG